MENEIPVVWEPEKHVVCQSNLKTVEFLISCLRVVPRAFISIEECKKCDFHSKVIEIAPGTETLPKTIGVICNSPRVLQALRKVKIGL